MIALKYQKHFPLAAVSHIDLLKDMGRVFQRMKLNVECSQGFNPHMLYFFSPALSLGVESDCEWVVVQAPYSEDFIERFNAVACPGLLGLCALEVPKNPNLAAAVVWARYEATLPCIPQNGFDFVLGETLTISYENKGETVQKDVRPMVRDFSCEGNTLCFTLACGNSNLKAERFLKGITQIAGVPYAEKPICKKEMYYADGKTVWQHLTEDYIEK